MKLKIAQLRNSTDTATVVRSLSSVKPLLLIDYYMQNLRLTNINQSKEVMETFCYDVTIIISIFSYSRLTCLQFIPKV